MKNKVEKYQRESSHKSNFTIRRNPRKKPIRKHAIKNLLDLPLSLLTLSLLNSFPNGKIYSEEKKLQHKETCKEKHRVDNNLHDDVRN